MFHRDLPKKQMPFLSLENVHMYLGYSCRFRHQGLVELVAATTTSSEKMARVAPRDSSP